MQEKSDRKKTISQIREVIRILPTRSLLDSLRQPQKGEFSGRAVEHRTQERRGAVSRRQQICGRSESKTRSRISSRREMTRSQQCMLAVAEQGQEGNRLRTKERRIVRRRTRVKEERNRRRTRFRREEQ
jgi:hypothetical protein